MDPVIIRLCIKSNFWENIHGSSRSSTKNDRFGGTLEQTQSVGTPELAIQKPTKTAGWRLGLPLARWTRDGHRLFISLVRTKILVVTMSVSTHTEVYGPDTSARSDIQHIVHLLVLVNRRAV